MATTTTGTPITVATTSLARGGSLSDVLEGAVNAVPGEWREFARVGAQYIKQKEQRAKSLAGGLMAILIIILICAFITAVSTTFTAAKIGKVTVNPSNPVPVIQV